MTMEDMWNFLANHRKTWREDWNRKLQSKVIKHYSSHSIDSETCVVNIYTTYLCAIGEDSGTFYRRPSGTGFDLRFSQQPVGVNTLGKLMKNMCQRVGLVGNFSNHSCKRTCATTLFNAGVDEQLIMERTGHCSNAVRAYKLPSSEQLRESYIWNFGST